MNTEPPDNNDAPKNNDERVYRPMPTFSSLQDLLKDVPEQNQVYVKEPVAEIRKIVSKVAEAGGVIYIGDIAKMMKTLKIRPEYEILKEFIVLAAEEELRESGVDLKAAVIHRTLGSVSRFYLSYGTDGEEAKKARRDWAIALEKVHKHFSGEVEEKDDFDIPDEAAA